MTSEPPSESVVSVPKCLCRVLASAGLPCYWKGPFGPGFLESRSSSAKMTAYFLVWFSTMFWQIHCGVRFDKIELTFDMYIAKPHPEAPLWLFDVFLRRRESKNLYKEELAPCSAFF